MKRVRKQRKLFIFGLILLLIGCGILLYPHILQKFYKIKTESMFRQFEETTENVRDANPEKYARLYEEMKNYNEELIKNNQENLADPYAYANPAIRLEEYGVEDGIAGYIKKRRYNIKRNRKTDAGNLCTDQKRYKNIEKTGQKA